MTCDLILKCEVTDGNELTVSELIVFGTAMRSSSSLGVENEWSAVCAKEQKFIVFTWSM